MSTVRLTMAQALVRFLENQYLSWDGQEAPFVRGVFLLPGHGNVVGLGQALLQQITTMAIHQMDGRRLQLTGSSDDMADHGTSGNRMENFGQRGPHASTFTRRKNDNMQGHSKPDNHENWANDTSSQAALLPGLHLSCGQQAGKWHKNRA